MKNFYDRNRDAILFFWGLCTLTIVILGHIVTDEKAYIILAGAIGLPIVLRQKNSGNKS